MLVRGVEGCAWWDSLHRHWQFCATSQVAQEAGQCVADFHHASQQQPSRAISVWHAALAADGLVYVAHLCLLLPPLLLLLLLLPLLLLLLLLQVDANLMAELQNIKAAVHPTDTLLVVDAMTGQEAATLVKTFNDQVDISGEKKRR
jgi:hypothetical protein